MVILQTESNLECALAYARLGFYVFAMSRGSKKPFAKSHGKLDATNDLATIERMFRDHPDANVALAPALSGFVVLDLDYRNGGMFIIAEIIATCGTRPLDTPTVVKPTGPHFYFLPPKDTFCLEGGNLSLRKGVDVIGALAGAKDLYVVVPPSLHPSGSQYVWAEGRALGEFPIQPFPMELLPILRKPGLPSPATHATPSRSTISARHRVSKQPSRDDQTATDPLRAYDRQEQFARDVARRLNIPFHPNRSFNSPLRPDEHPSACIYLTKEGYYRYHDFGMEEVNRYFSLAQVFGGFITGRNSPLPVLTKVGFARWQERLLLELGYHRVPFEVEVPALPSSAPESARRALAGFKLLLECEAAYKGKVVAVPFTHTFCAQWIGVDYAMAEAGVRWLRDKKLLIAVNRYSVRGGRYTNLYLTSNYIADAGVGESVE
jgi:hypothetical protein